MMIDFSLVRRQVPLLSYLQSLGVKLRQVGNHYVGKCPLHGERKGESFTVQGDKWKCWGACGAHGDVIDYHMSRLGLSSLEDAIKSLLGGEVPVTDDEVKREPRAPPKPAPPYELTDANRHRMKLATFTLRKNPELIFTVLGERPEWSLETVCNTAADGDLGFEQDCVWQSSEGVFDGPAVLFGYSHGLKARWLINGERVVRWLCGSPAGECWRQSLLRCARRRIYLTEGEPDTLTAISLGFGPDSFQG
jgi:hypothetical protein